MPSDVDRRRARPGAGGHRPRRARRRATSCSSRSSKTSPPKKHLFSELDRICGDGDDPRHQHVDAPVVEMAMETGRPERVCGIHFFNPAPVMALVEVVRRDHHVRRDDRRGARVRRGVRQDRGARCSDQAGFIVNALLFPYLNNAVKLLDAGVATRDDIDAAMKGGCNFPMGPLELLDLVGPRHQPGDPRGALRRVPRPQLRAGAAAAADGERRAPRAGSPASASTTTASRRPQRPVRSGPDGENGAVADRPWLMRTYSGHSSARASNELYRTNLAKGQTGLSVAFDLPTQTGYDPDHPLARGEVGKVGVPVPHLGEMRDALRRHPARRDEHVDDDQRHRDVAARHVPRAGRGARRRSRAARRAPRRTTS